LFHALQPFFAPGTLLAAFAGRGELAYAVPSEGETEGRAGGNRCVVEGDGQAFDIHVSTIAGVKGETHLATLVMESYRKPSYDLQAALPFLCGEKQAGDVENEALQRQLRNLFVAVTRPRRLLCAAMHRDRLSPAYEAKLREASWEIREVD
jgi:DNA helicase II / ATP-dependent DNA helicase PcrA